MRANYVMCLYEIIPLKSYKFLFLLIVKCLHRVKKNISFNSYYVQVGNIFSEIIDRADTTGTVLKCNWRNAHSE